MEYLPIIFIYLSIFILFLIKPETGFLLFIFTTSFDNFLYWDATGFKIKIYQIFLLAGLLTFLIMNLLSKSNIKKDSLFPLLLLYWSVGFVSLINAVNKTDAYIIITIELISISIYFFITQMVRTEGLIKKILKTIILSGNFVALYSIFQVIGYNLGLDTNVMHTNLFFFGRPVGTFYESNYLGAYSMSISLIILSLLLSSQKEISKGYLGLSLFLQILTLFLSMTRGAWLGLFFGILLLLIFLTVREKRWISLLIKSTVLITIMVFISLMFLYIFSPSVSEALLERFATFINLDFDIHSYSSESVRLSMMLRSYEMIKNNLWIGYGPGQAVILTTTFDWYDPAVSYLRRGAGSSNLFLAILFQRGILGLIIFILFLLILLTKTLKSLKRIENDFQRAALRSVFLSFCSLLFTFMATENHLLAFFWVQIALIISIINLNRNTTMPLNTVN